MNDRIRLLFPSSTWRSRYMSVASALLIFAFSALPAHALQGCRPTDSLLVCRLHSILTMLYAAAAILALLLICAVAAALRAYRRKSRKLSPDDITPDAE